MYLYIVDVVMTCLSIRLRDQDPTFMGELASPLSGWHAKSYSRDHVRLVLTIVLDSGKNGHPVGILT